MIEIMATVMLLIRHATGEKNRTPSQPYINLTSDVWMVVATCSPQARHKLVTSLATCTLCRGRREGGATWKKCCNTMFGYWSQHARHKLATCSPQARNIARNMYTMSGEEGGGRNMEKVLQHDVWILVATCSPQACSMFATNSQHRTQHVHYLRRGGKGAQHGKVFATWEKVFATWKKCSHMGKCARNMENVFST
jgi:hypothetical protein